VVARLEYSNATAQPLTFRTALPVLPASFVYPFIAGLDPAIHHAKKMILLG
jgi:hypothetical protein